MQEGLNEALIREFVDALPLGIMILSGGRVLSVNRCLADWLGQGPEVLAGLDEAGAGSLGLGALFRHDEEIPAAGGRLLLRRRRRPCPKGMEMQVFEEQSELVRACRERDAWRARAEALDPVDPETGLVKRAALLQSLDRQLSLSRRYGNPLAVVRLTLAPVAGRPPLPALGQFARELRADLRWVDQVGRYGPASLLAILPETPLEAAVALARKLGRTRAPWTGLDDFELNLGVAGWVPGDDLRKLLARVERSLADL
jgi:GGDEF domain-containing protein